MLLSRMHRTDADFTVTMSLKSRFPVSFGVYNYDVICDVIASIQTVVPPIVPYLDVHIDTFIFFSQTTVKIISMNIHDFPNATRMSF